MGNQVATEGFLSPEAHPSLLQILSEQMRISPNQAGFFSKRFSANYCTQFATAELLAEQIINLVGVAGLSDLVADYQWMCEMLLEEEMHFRRTKNYRLNTFKEAVEQVYSNDQYMERYLNGLLLSQIWWSNHCEVFQFYVQDFLPSNTEMYSHLEVGPGHGLFLFQACNDVKCASAVGWDIAPQSIENIKLALRNLKVGRMPDFEVRDILDIKDEVPRFDSVVCSEVLEHLEEPEEALMVLKSLLSPNGRLFLNVPVNSPAPDHLFLLRKPEALVELVTSHGFKVVKQCFAPQTNSTLEKALKNEMTISCALILAHKDS